MAYSDDITALSPDHLWRFDGDQADSVGSLVGTATGIVAGPAITEDALASRQSNGTGDRIALATAATVDQQLSRKAIGGWIELSAIQLPPKSIYREGTTANQLCFVCWAGNNVMLDIVNASGNDAQIFSEAVFQPGRAYHIFAVWSGTGFDDTIELFVDGVSQGSAPSGGANFGDRDVGEWSDPSGSTEVGDATVLLNGLVNGDFAFWASWADKVLPTAAQIRSELFEKGALPDLTVPTGTEAAMQSTVNSSLNGTLRPDAPLAVRVEANTGDTDFELTLDDVTFDPLASIHIQYTGTGTLTVVNTNGSNAAIGSTPNGGTINFVNPATITLEPLIAGSEIVISEAGTQNELASSESTGTSYSTSLQASSVDVRIHKDDYEFIKVAAVDMSQGDVLVPISQVFDLNYENP